MSKIEVNTVEPQCGTTLTLGASGDTVTLGSGATQTGFGRTGTVDWQTGSIKTATFTAANGEGYFCNTAGGTFEVDLPAGSAGAIVSVQDYNNTFDTNALTVDPNGSEKINGGSAGEAVTLDTEGRGVTFVYIDSTVGWRSVQDNDFTKAGQAAAFVCASVSGTGNTLTTAPCGNYKLATFTGPGNFTVSSTGNPSGSDSVEYIIVGGGGAGGGRYLAGGGGAGGFRFASPSLAPATYPAKPLAAPANISVTAQAYPIVIGGGGTGNACGGATDSTPGANTTALGLTAAGGGGGKQDQTNPPQGNRGTPGGSGGGGAAGNPGCLSIYRGGVGNDPSVSPSQGNPGGAGNQTSIPQPVCGPAFNNGAPYVAGGGGGAIAAGVAGLKDGPGNPGSAGTSGPGGAGAGVPVLFGTSGQNCGSNYYFAGGGGASGTTCSYTTAPGTGGLGGGAAGNRNAAGVAGSTNTGGGGGGTDARTPPTPYAGGNGGSGIVIIRYKFQ